MRTSAGVCWRRRAARRGGADRGRDEARGPRHRGRGRATGGQSAGADRRLSSLAGSVLI